MTVFSDDAASSPALAEDDWESLHKQIGVRLREMRRACGATQRELAKASGVSVSTIRRFERGLLKPGSSQFVDVVLALRASPAYLIGGIDPPDEATLAQMRLNWTLGRVPPEQADTILRLIEGVLAEAHCHIMKRAELRRRAVASPG